MTKMYLTGVCCVFMANVMAQVSIGLQSPVAQQVATADQSGKQIFYPLIKTFPSAALQQVQDLIPTATFAAISSSELSSIYNKKLSFIEMKIPFREKEMELQLIEVKILTDDFSVITDQSDGNPVPYTPGIYYRGIVKNDPQSLVSFSFFEGEMMGMISREEEGNIVVGKVLNTSNDEYIIYSDRDLAAVNPFACGTFDDPAYAPTLSQYALEGGSIRTVNCVKMYYELDYDIYISSGNSTTTATNWATSIHNNVATIYTNEQVNTGLSQVYVWTTLDPFTGATSYAQLILFKQTRITFNGDVGILLALDPGGLGGIASTINGLCTTNYKYAYGDISYSYNSVPTYSWTIEVVMHEFGHLVGSYHTHNCTWPNGAIDNCYTPEGTCATGPAPTNGGTVMSYCHLTSYGINFNNAFGLYPGNAIRGAVNAATCLSTTCGATANYCTAAGSTSFEWIQSTTFGTTTNNSGSNNGYGNLTANAISMTIGSSVPFSLSPGFTSTLRNEYYSIWIDYNSDYDFADAGENVFNSGGSMTTVTGNLTIPTAASGTRRMRVAMKYSSLPSSCGSYSFGEVEDYTVSFVANTAYCTSAGTNATVEWIDRVKISNIDRTSGSDGGYFNGTSIIANVMKGSSYTLTRSAGMSGPAHLVYWKAWADWNHDGDFEDSGEELVNSSSSSKAGLNTTVIIPTTSVGGSTRLRVSMKNGSTPTSCQTFSNGEVEDYTLNITPLMPEADLLVPEIESILLFPNPAFSDLNIQFHLEQEAKTLLTIYDLSGRSVISENKQGVTGTNALAIQVDLLPNGIYLLHVSNNEFNRFLRFEVQR